MLHVENVTVRFGGHVALDRVDLEVPRGEVLSVLGPSGSGKSTLLRVIAGLQQPEAGTVRWDGHDITAVASHRRNFGLMFQDHALFPHRDVLGNVMFGPRMAHVDRKEAEQRARVELVRVGLRGFEDRRIGELSGGEQQRVALARALAADPQLLMLDEPLGALDRRLRDELVEQLRTLFDELDLTVISVTHDHDEAFALGDRVAIVHDGRIDQVGDAQAVWARPATEFAARFLGFDNVTDAVVREGRATSAWGEVPAPGLGDGPVRLACRPTGWRVDDAGPVSVTIGRHTYRRDHFLVRGVDTTGGEIVVAWVGAPPDLGAVVRLALDPDEAVVLPARPV